MINWIAVGDLLPDKDGIYLTLRTVSHYPATRGFHVKNGKWDEKYDPVLYWAKCPRNYPDGYGVPKRLVLEDI